MSSRCQAGAAPTKSNLLAGGMVRHLQLATLDPGEFALDLILTSTEYSLPTGLGPLLTHSVCRE